MSIPIEDRRNIGVMAHIDAGKTTVTERMLYYTGRTYKIGEVDEGTTVTDWMSEEQKRGITITSAAVTCHWKDWEINLIDTPGHVDFTAEVERSIRVLDGAVAVLCAVGGVEAQTETVWLQADKYHVPRIVFVNKLDRVGADFDQAVNELREKLQANPLPIQMPVGLGREFVGVIDLITMTMYKFDPEEYGKRVEMDEIPGGVRPEAESRREQLIEKIAELDEAVMEKFIHEEPIDEELIHAALRRLTLDASAVPVLCGSALKYQGVQLLLDAIGRYLPSPIDAGGVEGVKTGKKDAGEKVVRKPSADEPFAALAFKLTFDRYDVLTYIRIYSGTLRVGNRLLNPRTGKRERIRKIYKMYANKREEELKDVGPGEIVGVVGLEDTSTGDTLCDIGKPLLLEHLEFPQTVISMAIEPRSQADREKLNNVLDRIMKEDPTLAAKVDPETGQLVLSGMGELHLEVVKNRLLEEFGVAANVGALRVAYKETAAAPSEGEGEFIQQTGAKGQFARVKIKIEPVALAGKVEFENQLKDKELSKPFVEAVESSVRENAMGGIITGYPLVNISVTLTGAEERQPDSSEMAFYAAAGIAMRKAVEKVGIKLLEPVMSVEVIVPEEYFGEVVKDLQARRGELQHMSDRSSMKVISSLAPLAEMFGYATALRSLTRGRGTYTMEPCEYWEAPQNVFDKVAGYLH